MKRTIGYAFGFAVAALCFAVSAAGWQMFICVGCSLRMVQVARREMKLIKKGKLPA